MTTKNKKTAFYTALAKAPGLLKEYIKQYTQGQVDFPDELVEAFTQAQGDVKKIEQMCNNLKKSKEGAQIMKVAEQVYAAAQQEIDAEVNNSTGLFKDGGKFQYLRKLAWGGNTEENNNSDKKKSSKNKSTAKRRDLDSPTGFRTVRGMLDEETGEPVDVVTPQEYGFQRDSVNTGEAKYVGNYVYPLYNREDGHIIVPALDESRGQIIYEDSLGQRDTAYFNYPDEKLGNGVKWILNGTAPDQEAAKKLYYQFLEYVNPQDYPEVKKAKAEKHGWGGHIRKGMKWLLGKSDDASRTVKNIPANPRIPKSNTYPSWGPQDLDIDKPFILKRGTDLDIDNVIYKGSPRYEIPTYDLPTFKMSDDLQKLLDDVKSGKIKLTK